MPLSPFHAYYQARTLSDLHVRELTAAYASSNVDVFPYQVAASLFALRSPLLRGAVLCDDGSLGKTYEALLILTQKWCYGYQKTIIIVPTPLVGQWVELIDSRFSLPLYVVDGPESFQKYIDEGQANPFRQPGAVLTTYDFAAEKESFISQIEWDTAVFEEAHHLRKVYTGESKKLSSVRAAVGKAFKLLLTATPVQTSILDIYGLINFIDEQVFFDETSFYRQYFRKPENYGELAERLASYCFRTRRDQVEQYVKIPRRLPLTCEIPLSGDEKKLADLLGAYLNRPHKYAFPQMDSYDLSLLLWRTFSSSYAAFARTISGVAARLERLSKDEPEAAEELAAVNQMLEIAERIKGGAKSEMLLTILKQSSARLKEAGAAPKALIFTENASTQKFLYNLLNRGQYKGKVLMFNGRNSRDYEIMAKFRDEARILIASDVAAEGFCLEFCSLVINYDLPYNALKVEQRVNRCHRQGQLNDVLVINFINRENFADVRLLELVNKRLLQFDGIFGLAEDWLGEFHDSATIRDALGQGRHRTAIDQAFDETLSEHKQSNLSKVAEAEKALEMLFDRQISRETVVSPQYIKDKVAALNDQLWSVTRWFFDGKSGYELDDESRTITIGFQPEKIFTGSRPGRREYSMFRRDLPKSGWYTITSPLAQNILGEIFWRGIPDQGQIEIEGPLEKCRIGFYEIRIKSANDFFNRWRYYRLAGQTASGRILDEEECREIMARPVASFASHGPAYGRRDGDSKPKPAEALDQLIEAEPFIQETLQAADLAEKQEMERLKAYNREAKISLERNLDRLKQQVRQAESGLNASAAMLDRLEAQKSFNALCRDLKLAEQNLFLDKIKLDQQLEDQIEGLRAAAKLSAEIIRHFAVDFKGQ
ncbi:hypothetical protein C4J81_01805 [Deltaproteobacteria bacterium Smac51]|nr:hypothetical protein C4J81_01805 [Deltaproteobacteria bacterium Smac51]